MKNREASLRRLLHIVRLLNQKNRAAGQTYGLPISLLDSEILVEVKAEPGIVGAELSRRLGVSPMSSSRHIKGLVSEGLLQLEKDPKDARNNHLRLRADGEKMLTAMTARGKSAYGAAFKRLNANEQIRFKGYTKQFADGLGFSPASSIPNDPPLMADIRTITRGLGFLGTDIFFGSDLGPFEWQVLSHLCAEAKDCHFTDFIELFSAPRGSMSSVLIRLKKRGYITTHKTLGENSSDARKSRLVPTTLGKEKSRAIEARGILLISNALRDLDFKSLEDFSSLAEKYAANSGNVLDVQVLPDLSITRLKLDQDLNLARQFLIEFYAEYPVKKLAASMAANMGITFGVYHRNQMCGVVDFNSAHGHWELHHLCLRARAGLESSKTSWKSLALARVLEEFSKISSAEEVTFDAGHLGKSWKLLSKLQKSKTQLRLREVQ